jgi:hypothetical protein
VRTHPLQHHEQAFAAVLISFDTNPTAFTDFNNSAASPLLFNYTQLTRGAGVSLLEEAL